MKSITITRFDKKLNKEVSREYFPVVERVKFFRESDDFKGWAILTEVVNLTDDGVTIKATVQNQEGVPVSSGIAHEEKSWGEINSRSMVENCETSAVGRALAFLNIGVTDDIASADEMPETDNSGEAGYAQISMIEELLRNSSIPEKHAKQIESELQSMTAGRATKCIKYLKDNQVNETLDKQLTNKLNDERQ